MYIKKIKVNKVRHLENFEIDLGEEKKHLIITGKNGSGKTSLLEELNKTLTYSQIVINRNHDNTKKSALSIKMTENLKNEKEFVENSVIAIFRAKRKLEMVASRGVEVIDLAQIKKVRNNNGPKQFLKYLVHLKTQLAYAVSDNAEKEIERISNWFNRFENLLKTIFENEKIELIYERKKYNFLIKDGEKQFDFNQLSDGFSSILEIITGIMMQMEKEEEELHDYNMNGIVLIDEIDTHLHISLQKKILKVLDEFFPNIQFIVTTHSPFILNSVSNAVIYDLEKQTRVEDMSAYPYETISEVYFDTSNYSDLVIEKINNFEKLIDIQKRTLEEEEKLMELKEELNSVTPYLAKKLAMKIWALEERMS